MSFGDERCRQLANMRAENLKLIYLRNNNIGPEGCFALTEANWTKISIIDFGNYI